MAGPTQDARTFKTGEVDEVQIALLKTQREQAKKGGISKPKQHTGSLWAKDVDEAQIALFKTQKDKAEISRIKLILPKVVDKR